jgi:hypothetical protein
MVNPKPLIVATQLVADAFDQLKIPYYISGSVASSYWGVDRFTRDADIVVDLHPKDVAPLVALLKSEFIIDADVIRSTIAARSSCYLVHMRNYMTIDLYMQKGRPQDKVRIERRMEVDLQDGEDSTAYMSSPEDTILAKLEWYVATEGSVYQWDDVVGVLVYNLDLLDMTYLRRWADQLNVADLLEKAIGEAQAQLGG